MVVRTCSVVGLVLAADHVASPRFASVIEASAADRIS